MVIYELRFSEDEACRRVAAARLVKRFPVLLDAVAAGELHLTGLLLLGPHLTESNLTEVLALAKHRTKRELAQLVRILDPLLWAVTGFPRFHRTIDTWLDVPRWRLPSFDRSRERRLRRRLLATLAANSGPMDV